MTMHETASTISLRDLVAQFNWERVTGDDTTLERLLETAATNRPGLELSGYFPNTAAKRLAILGDKEIGYIYFGKKNFHKKVIGFIMAKFFGKKYKQSF